MARQETINVSLNIAQAQQAAATLQQDAARLREAFGNITVTINAQSLREAAQAQAQLAQAQNQGAQAAIQQANAQAATLRVRQQQVNLENAMIRQTQINANAQAAALRVQREQANLDRAHVQLQQQVQRGNQQQINAMRQLGQAYGQVNQAQSTNLQAMTQWIQSQDGMANAQVRATGAINNAAGSFQTYRASVAAGEGAVHNYRIAVDTANGAVYQLDQGVRNSSTGFQAMTAAAQSTISVLRQLVGFYGVGASLRKAFSEMKSMSDEMIVYQKVTKATSQEMEKVRADAYESALRYGQTPTDFLAAASEMARAGYKENSTAMADLAVKTRLVGDITAEEASKFLLAVDAGYKFQGNVEQLSAVLDQANEIGNNFATSIGKISEGMTLIASLGGQVGVPIEQMMAALGTMTAVTQRSGSEMARALRSVFLNILKDTTSEVEEGVTVTEDQMSALDRVIEKFGDDSMKAARAAGQLVNPLEVIGKLSQAYKSGFIKDQAELFNILKDIGGQRYYNALAALIENYDTMYQEMLEYEKDAAGSAQKEADVLAQSWESKLNQLSTTWTRLVNNTISENFIKNLIDGGKGVLEFAGNLENLATMALGAHTAIRALSTGLSNLGRGQAFGGFNAWSIGIGAAITAIGIAVSAYENNIRKVQEQAAKSTAEVIQKSQDIDKLYEIRRKYTEIAADGIDEEAGEVEQLKTLQSELNALCGEQAGQIDLANGSYEKQIELLTNLSKKRAEENLDALKAQQISNVSDFNNTSDLNGPWQWGTSADGWARSNVSFLGANALITEWLSTAKYLRGVERELNVGAPVTALDLQMRKPDEADEIVAFYDEVKDFYEYLGSTGVDGSKAAQTGVKTLGEEYSKTYQQVSVFWSLVKDAAQPTVDATKAYTTALATYDVVFGGFIKDTYESSDALNADVDALIAAKGATGEYAEAIRKAAEEYARLAKAGSDSAGNDTFNKQADSANTLAAAIEAATQAKKDFDEAMKSTKGDAFAGYMSAYETYKKEMEEGRVNSTAMYAAARMMLGEEKYAATEKTSMAMEKALTEKAEGAVGSILQGWEILNQEYKDSKGNVVQGAGVYELLKRSGIYSAGELVDENGNLYIPQMTEEKIKQLSDAFSGLNTDAIKAALQALAQYDKYGRENDEDILGDKRESAEKAAESAQKASETAEEVANNTANTLRQTADASEALHGGFKSAEAEASAAAKASEGAAESADAMAESAQQSAEASDSAAEASDSAAESTQAMAEASTAAAESMDGVATSGEAAAAALAALAAVAGGLVGGGTGGINVQPGNVDVNNRPVISAKKLIEAGWDGVGDPENIATLFSQVYSAGDTSSGYDWEFGENTGLVVTPILPDGSVLTPQQLEGYLGDIISKSSTVDELIANDKNGYNVITGTAHIAGSLVDAYEKLDQWAEELHLEQAERYEELAKTEIQAEGVNIQTSESQWMSAVPGVSEEDKKTGIVTSEKASLSSITEPATEQPLQTSERQWMSVAPEIQSANQHNPLPGEQQYEEQAREAKAEYDSLAEEAEVSLAELERKQRELEIQRVAEQAATQTWQGAKEDDFADEEEISLDDYGGIVPYTRDAAKEHFGVSSEGANAPPQESGGAGNIWDAIYNLFVSLLDGAGAEGAKQRAYSEKGSKAGEASAKESTKASEKKWDSYNTTLQKIDAFEQHLSDSDDSIGESLTELGVTWQEVQKAYSDLGENIDMYNDGGIKGATNAKQFVQALKEFYGIGDDTTVEVAIDGDNGEAKQKLDEVVNAANSKKAQISLGARTSEAKNQIDSFINSQNGRKITLQVETSTKSGESKDSSAEGIVYNASGTRFSPGGLSMVNDGTGPEIVVQRGRAFIPAGGRPALINLDYGAKVFNASETRAILGGRGVPAFASGTDTSGITLGPLTPSSAEKEKQAQQAAEQAQQDYSNKQKEKEKAKDSEESKNDAWSELSSMVDYIVNKIGKSIDKQIDELEQEREAAKQQNELADKQEAVAKAQADLNDAMNERTVRYLGEDGKWHWMADARNVKKAQESLDDAKKALQEYEDDMAFNDKIKALRAEYDKLANAWQEIKDAVATPTGALQSLISAVLSGGTPQERTGANAVSNYLLSQLIPGTNIEGDYNAALTAIARATAGNPIMPNEDLATIIANAGATGMGNGGGGLSGGRKTGFTADQILALQKQGYTPQMIKEKLMNDNSSVTNYNYSINGVKIGADEANTQPLSKTMKKLSVYSNSMVS